MTPRLRIYSEYDKNGRDTIVDQLQVWNEDDQCWEGVPSVRVSYKEREEAMSNPDY